MKSNRPIWTILAMLAASQSGTALAAQLSLSQAPPGTATEPTPNIIVSVDDSGSMGSVGMTTLRSALTQTFATANVADDRIRLAWQSMNRCRGIPSSDPACNNLNGMRSLSGTHRTNFLNWVNGLVQGGGTHSHFMFAQGGDYLARTDLGINSPWASSPGVQLDPIQSCRKSFQIFMTDGNWNSGATYTNDHVDTAGTNGVRVVRGGGNVDGVNKTLGDGTTAYDIASNNTRLYRDTWGRSGGGTQLSTLSDLAFHYWSTDLQPTLTNNVAFKQKVTTAETVGATTVQPFWNPKNNPANWQHMVTYTIGFDADGAGPGAGADQWAGAPLWGGSTYAGDYPGLTAGSVAWPTPFCGSPLTSAGNGPCDGSTGYSQRGDARKAELWHAALNARGQFVPAPNAQALVNAFKGILDEILADTARPLVSIASSSSRLRSDGFVYVAGFDSGKDWSGELSAFTIAATDNAIGSTPVWRASTALDSATFVPANRVVLTRNATGGTGFAWNNLAANQQTLLRGSDTALVGEQRVNYLRGDRALEVKNGGTMRNRSSRLGDIVNSNIWNTGQPRRMSFEHADHASFRSTINALNGNLGRTPMLYVGANDGMLHGFNASNGAELLAYVPRGVYSTLRDYTLPAYGHRFYVDGQPFTGDADLNPSATSSTWRTLLVSGLGGGGRGYFVLDVTNPANFTVANAASTVLLDNSFSATGTDTFTGYQDVGHIYAQPTLDPVAGNRSEQIVKLNNDRWAVVLGNGVNSINERPVLLVQYLDGARELTRLVADSTLTQGNGLSAPRLVDVNGDGRMDVVYAGDLRGNLWKFDLTSSNPTNWGVANWSTGSTVPCKPIDASPQSCTPLYVAKDASGNRQPITTAPIWIAHPTLGGVQLGFGTGRNFTTADRSNTDQQTLYSVLDKTQYTVNTATNLVVPVASTADTQNIAESEGRTLLIEQEVVSRVGSTDYYNTSENEVDYGLGQRGWYFDLPEPRERVLVAPQIFQGQKVLLVSTLPKTGTSGESCEFVAGADDNWVNVLNMFSGKPSKEPVWPAADNSRDKATRTRFGEGEFISLDNKTGDKTDLISIKNDPNCVGSLCTESLELTGSNPPGARADWREVR
jgi:type IV pilus assembly protein PilY1